MMEHNTDRLFWTLTSIIVGALLLTISVKAFPGVANTVTAPMSGITKQADKSTTNSDQAYKNAINSVNSSQQTDQDAQAKASAVEANTLNLKVTPNGDGTGMLAGPANGTLSGTLNIPKYVKVNGQLTKITSIGFNAFNSNNLTSVNIPNSITSIGDDAFNNNVISSATIPNSITYLGNAAFNNNKLTSVTIPNSITTIGNSTFNNNKLTSITIPNNITNIQDGAFGGNQLTSINIPNSVTSIGMGAFSSNQLTSVNISNSVTSIGRWAFSNNQLTSVNIPNAQGYQYVNNGPAVFDDGVTITNNTSN